ncbi:MAG: DUF1800 family protein [Parvularculaceae bacterium]
MLTKSMFAVRWLRAVSCAAALGIAGCTVATEDPVPGAPGAAGVSDSPTASEASRFLMQATFGPTEDEINDLVRMGYSEWFRRQLNRPVVQAVPYLLGMEVEYAMRNEELGPRILADFAWKAAIEQDDQLRQRTVFALSQIIVVSYEDMNVSDIYLSMGRYIDVLNENAFGSYRTLIEDITYTPSMAIYLTFLNNWKENSETGSVPDENYARELMQLFTIGLVQLNQDGTLQLDTSGNEIETYTNDDITELAKVFTGLSWADDDFGGRSPQSSFPAAAYMPLKIFPEQHSTSSKTFLTAAIPANTDAATSIDLALDELINHQNVAPFISKQLIQRFVTSNPTPAYVQRVTDAFVAGAFTLPDRSTVGSQTRGDLAATIAAILLDPEARDLAWRSDPAFGRIREPVIRLAHWARISGLNTASVLGANGLLDNESLQETVAPNRLGQQHFRSPSVFNFYRPGYVASGSETAAAGLVAPELQVTTTTSVTSFANFMRSLIQEARQDRTFLPSYSRELGIADNADALVDRLNLVLTANTMTPETRARIINAVNGVSIRADQVGVDLRNRVNLAMLMTILSSEYTVQR